MAAGIEKNKQIKYSEKFKIIGEEDEQQVKNDANFSAWITGIIIVTEMGW